MIYLHVDVTAFPPLLWSAQLVKNSMQEAMSSVYRMRDVKHIVKAVNAVCWAAWWGQRQAWQTVKLSTPRQQVALSSRKRPEALHCFCQLQQLWAMQLHQPRATLNIADPRLHSRYS